MDIAVTSLIPQGLFDSSRSRVLRAENEQQQNKVSSIRSSSNNIVRDEVSDDREVSGEFLSFRPVQRRGVGRIPDMFLENSANASQSDNRRFSLRAAVQTFEDNEALILEPGQQKQLSGIIDEFV